MERYSTEFLAHLHPSDKKMSIRMEGTKKYENPQKSGVGNKNFFSGNNPENILDMKANPLF